MEQILHVFNFFPYYDLLNTIQIEKENEVVNGLKKV